MKMCGLGDPRLDARVHVDLVRQPVALAAVARRAGRDDVVPARRAALRARDHVVDGEAGAGAAVLALPAVAGEHGAAGDLPLVRVARDLHVGDEPDHDRLGERAVGPVQRLAADLDHLGLVLQEQDRRAAHGAHVDGLIRRVEHQHTTTRPTATAVGIRSVPRVVSERHRPCWAWWYCCRHDLAECSYGADGNDPSTRTPSAWERNAPIAWATSGSSARPSQSTKNMYVPSPRRRGRDSIRVRLTSRSANSARQRTSQPGAVVGRLPEHQRGLPARRPRRVRRLAGDPHEARLRARRVLDVRGQHRAAVELGRRAAAERRPRLAALALGDDPHGVGGRGGVDHRGARQPGAQERGALAARLRVRGHGGDPLELDRLARDQAVVDREHELAGDLDVVGLERERVERRVDRALERVLDRHQRALHAALVDRHHRVVDRRQRHRLVVLGAGPGEHRLLAVRSRPGRGSRPSSLQRGGAVAGQGAPHGLDLLGRELELALPVDGRACSRCGRCRGARSRTSRRRCAARRAARSSSTGCRSAPRRRRSGRASGRRSRRRAAPRRPRGARRR